MFGATGHHVSFTISSIEKIKKRKKQKMVFKQSVYIVFFETLISEDGIALT